jgi:hypothetical protein
LHVASYELSSVGLAFFLLRQSLFRELPEQVAVVMPGFLPAKPQSLSPAGSVCNVAAERN